MAETIRDVVVKIRLEQTGGKSLRNTLAKPMAEVAKSARDAKESYDDLDKKAAAVLKSIVTPAEKLENTTRELGELLAKEKITQQDYNRALSKAKEVFEKTDPAIKARIAREKELAKEQENALNTAKRRAAEESRAAAASAKEAEKSAQVLKEANIRVADGLRTTGEGFFTAARGAAFLFSELDDGYAELIRNVAIAQGAFDLFKGGVETIKGLKAATDAYTASQVAAGAATTATAAASTGLLATLGPIALAIGAVAAAYLILKRQAEPTIDRLKEATEEYRREVEVLEKAQARIANRNTYLDFLAKHAERPTDVRVALGLAAKEEAEFQKLQRLRVGLGQRFDRDALNPRLRGNRVKQGGNAEQAAFGILRKGLGGRGGRNKDDFRDALEAAKFLEEKERARLEISTRELSVKEMAKKANDDLIAGEKEKLRTLREQLKAQEDAVRSQQAAAGRLNVGEQSRLRQLVGKAKSGQQLSREELLQLERLGGSIDAVRQFTERQFAQRGQSVADEAAGIGGGSKLTGPDSRLESTRVKLQQQGDSFVDTLQTVADANKRNVDASSQIVKQVEFQVRVIDDLSKKIEFLQREVDTINAANRNP